VHSDFRGNPELGERSEAVSNRRNRQVVLTIDGAVDDMDVFDVATALPVMSANCGLLMMRAAWDRLGAEVAQDGGGFRDGVL